MLVVDVLVGFLFPDLVLFWYCIVLVRVGVDVLIYFLLFFCFMLSACSSTRTDERGLAFVAFFFIPGTS